MTNRSLWLARTATASAMLALSLPAYAHAADGLAALLEAFTSAVPLVNLRLRSETVGKSGVGRDGHALTLRTRLGFQTADAWHTRLLAEATLNWPWDTRYNDTLNHRTDYPVVADPPDYALDRLQLANTSLPHTLLIVGRQRIDLDDQRFIGSVGFRQNEQTFDAARVVNRSIPDLTLGFTYLNRVNRIFGTRSPAGRFTGNSYLAHIAYRMRPGVLSAFGYWLALDQDPAGSSRTLGARFAGAYRLEGIAWRYSLSYAHQDPYGPDRLRFSEDYYAARLSATYSRLTAGAGAEVLGGNGVRGFATPLATLHKFDGWADEFLTTPPDGIEDHYGLLSYALKRVGYLHSVSLTAIYHDFRSARLATPYGRETDLKLMGRWRALTGMIAFADYARDRFASSTRRIWIEVDYSLHGG